jgi:hypothetical protein
MRQTRSITSSWSWLLGVVCLLNLSCSPGKEELNPTEGKVLYKGQPLAGALVTFHPKGEASATAVRPTGLSKEDGTFTVMTGDKNGAPAGEYVVTIICSEVPAESKKEKDFATGGMETKDRLQGAYADHSKSKITVQIKSGTNKLEPFDLK